MVEIADSAWTDIAREHALTRVRLGFDVTQLVKEIIVLRRQTARIVRDEGLLDEGAIQVLVDLIDAAMTASIQSYVDFRDYAARRVEAEHIGFVTHELKNPIGVIMMATEQLCEHVPPEQRGLCDMVDRSVTRLRTLIDQVLTIERLRAADEETRPITLTLEQLLGDALEQFRHRAREKGLELETTFDPAIELCADPNLTRSAIENLLDNAIKYTDAGTVRFAVEDHASELEFHVRDQCGGIPRDTLRIIFEPFKRADETKPGTGLGLAITRRAVEVQGGRIHVESGRSGCHFWITLPKRLH
jgi:signal transduction histidine kinase